MRVQRLVFTLAFAAAAALPAALPCRAGAADDSSGGSFTDKARSAGESAKDAATSAGSTVKDSAKGAAGYVADTAKDAGTRAGGKDALFVRKAAVGGLAEVKSAELAKNKASSGEVKSFAEQMVKDHTKANQELEALAKQKGFTIPNALDNEHRAKIDELSGLSGEAFDKAYLKQQRMGHEKMLRLMQDEATNGKDPDLKSFAAKTEKVVSEHHARIQKISGTGGAHASRS
jgi:putative membrane protein